MRKVVGVDIGGTNIRIGVVDEELHLSHFEKTSSAFLRDTDSSQKLVGYLQSYLERYALTDIEAIRIGVPSMVGRDRDYVYRAPNLGGLVEVKLATLLSNALHLSVAVDRDVNHLLLYDIHELALDKKREKTILGFYIGTGLGNPIWLNGKIYRGKHGVAGELAHIPLYGQDIPCPCGGRGCVEMLASGRALERLQQRHFPDTPIEEIFTYHGDSEPIQHFIETLSYPLATEITIIDPDLIVLSSGVVGMNNFPKNRLIEEVKKRVKHPVPAEDLEYIFPETGHENGVIGAAIERFFYEEEH